MNERRNNSLQQCLVNKYRKNMLLLFIFFALLQPQIAIVEKNKNKNKKNKTIY